MNVFLLIICIGLWSICLIQVNHKDPNVNSGAGDMFLYALITSCVCAYFYR